MIEIHDDPKLYGLSHTTWRPNQLSFLRKVINRSDGDKKFVFGELATGSGKSVIPTVLSNERRVLVLVQTLGLLKQYEREYGFDIVMGRQEYPCSMPQKVREWKRRYNKTPTAADCHFDNMRQCSSYSDCPYVQARNNAILSDRAACTYRYAALSDEMKNRGGILVLDEAHNSAEEMLSLSEFSISQDQLDTHRMPEFPLESYGIDGDGDMLEKPARDKILRWLYACGDIVGRKDALDFMTEEGARQKGLAKYIDSGIKFIENTEDIFLYVGRDSTYWDAPFRLVLKPLSVLDLAEKMFENKEMVILMSATIGNPKPLATELGIEYFDSYTYAHPVPKEYRPIYDLGMERMTWENVRREPNLPRTQGLLIARFIKKFDPKWRGIVLTTSNYKVNELRKVLSEKLDGRIFIPSKQSRSVNRRISDFLNDTTPGLVSVDTIQGWGSGLDLSFDKARMSIIAGVPFLNPSSRYDVLRSERPGGHAYSLWNTFNAVVQACGRVSRGEIVDDDYLLNVAALADGSATTPAAKSQYPRWYKDAIIG